MLAYLSRYTHRLAIATSRLIAFDDNGVTFRWKDDRAKGRDRQKVMTLASDEFIWVSLCLSLLAYVALHATFGEGLYGRSPAPA